ncbi:RagB/SusD family nutrient uptake outer membrane protein [Sphingobacterium sp. SYP-B4668]|uniref:RagB/SusD family nutrient uptake outer membrane protein n=1 Tax=Sphingobacterium sp. SYP-B4668 TaxID=2996035 RepID=UPI0022DD0317|nr:RagB/SusD family nutrient uptake outer membrane protein [Sphingobacterium sp. SYP-B4668]
MKKTYKYIIFTFLCLGSFGIHSCNFLEIDPYVHDQFTLDSVFNRKEYTQKYLSNIYSHLPDYASSNYYTSQSMPYSLISDEAISTLDKIGTHNYNRFSNNLMTSEGLGGYSNRWDFFYQGIRKANVFLENVDKCKEVSEFQRSEWKGEALFLKANFYFELMLAFGPVPIVPDNPVSFDTPIDQMMLARNTWDECNTYVSNLLQQAELMLPEVPRDNSEFGKATKNASLAVLSRLSLYSASPLYNGQNGEFSNLKTKDGVPLLNPNFDSEKWAIAAAVAKKLILKKPNDLYTVPKMSNTPHLPVPAEFQGSFPDGVGGIDPYHSYADIFSGECVLPSENPEILFAKMNSNFSTRYLMPRMVGGYSDLVLSQNFVDDFYMVDGRDIHNASAEYPYGSDFTTNETIFSGDREGNGVTLLPNTHKWYVNREMRFYAIVAFNNSYYPSTSTPPNAIDPQDGKVAKYFRDSKSGKDYALNGTNADPEDYPMTGYLCKKYVHFEDSYISGGRLKRKYSVPYRMAEVYLNYVEALNELTGSHTVNGVVVSRDIEEMKRYFNMIRFRAGLPGLTNAEVSDRDLLRKIILRERKLEFAWEQRRYHDLRRTKQAMVYENEVQMGLNVSAKENEKDKFYSIVRLNERSYLYKVFTTRQTFLPIPKGEVDKNYNLQQNIGY